MRKKRGLGKADGTSLSARAGARGPWGIAIPTAGRESTGGAAISLRAIGQDLL